MRSDPDESLPTRKSAHKNKSSLYERDPLDFYVEPAFCTELLIDNLPGWENVWDPACGSGTIVKTMQANGIDAFGTDIIRRRYEQAAVMDFLALWTHGFPFTDIVTNPPYGKAEDFIRWALRKGPSQARRLAVLVRLDFLASQRRHALFTEHEPQYVMVLSRRPSMPPGDRPDLEAKGGQHDFMWLVFDRRRGHYARCEVRWLK